MRAPDSSQRDGKGRDWDSLVRGEGVDPAGVTDPRLDLKGANTEPEPLETRRELEGAILDLTWVR